MPSICLTSPPVDPDVHRRIRPRRLGLIDAMARVVANLAFGEPRDSVLIVTGVADRVGASAGVAR